MYWRPSRGGSTIEWAEIAILGDTYAPMPMMLEEVPPGAPTVFSEGPALPALLTKMTPCLLTTCNRMAKPFMQLLPLGSSTN